MSAVRTVLGLFVILAVTFKPLRGQEAIMGDRAFRLTDQFLQDDAAQGSLPPITVEPPPTLPEVDVTAPPNRPTRRVTPQPILGQPGRFGETTGVLRSQKPLAESTGAESVIDAESIREKSAPDMFQALQVEVGVMMQSTAAGQASPFVRGLTGQQVLILVDGIRLNNSTFRFGPNQYFNTIDPGMVDHIEVKRGASSVLWGSDAIGGAINVVTRGADMTCDYRGGEFTQYFNTANSSPYSRLNVEGSYQNVGVFTGGSFLNVRDLDTGFGGIGRQPGTNYQQYAGDLKLNYLISDNEMLTVALQHHEQEDLPRSDRFPGYPGDTNGSNNTGNARFFDPQQRDLAYIRYQALDVLPAIDALTFTSSYHRQREIQTRGIPTTRFQETDVETVGLNLVAAKDLDWFGKLTSGVDWYHDDVDSPFGGAAGGPIIPDDAFYERLGVFLNWDVPLTQRLDAVAGIRYEQIEVGATPVIDVMGVPTPVHISPRYKDWIAHVGLGYQLNSCLRLVGSVSEGFRAPNLDELTGNNPNVLQQGQDLPSLDLIPERSITYELGVKANYDRLRSDVFVFWNDLNNNVVPISAGANQFQRANQDSYIQGVEWNGSYRLRDGWSVYGNFWYTYGQNLVTDAPLSRIPPAQGIAGLRWRASDGRGYFAIYSWLVRRQDRLDPVRDIGDERIPPGGTPGFATLNLRCGRTLGCCDQHRVSLSLENITDQPYLVHGSGVLGTGITARLGYTWQF